MKILTTPFDQKALSGLRSGDDVLLSGTIYSARDQAHARIASLIRHGEKLPFDLSGQVVYYCGPTQTPPGSVIGSCGPTTSRRMDPFAPALIKAGLKGMIGKGDRDDAVIEAMRRYKAVYFAAYAGLGALMSTFVTGCRLKAFGELGPEAVYELEVKDMPLVVAIDCKGSDIYRR